MKPIKTDAIVLRRTNYGEADRIIQFITPQNGKIGVLAKGVRREKSKLAGGIELFSVSELTIIRGKGDLGTLTSSRLKKFYSNILADYDRLQFAYEVLKRTNQVAEYLEEVSLYDITLITLKSLDVTSIDYRIAKAWFYLQIAETLGHGLNLSRDNKNKPLASGKNYSFDIADMTFRENERGNFTEAHLKLLKILKLKNPEVVAHISGIEVYLDDCLSLAHAVGE